MKKYLPALAIIILIWSFVLPAAANPNRGLKLGTTSGLIEGYVDESTKTRVWKGIPYARPPIGALRWKAPKNPIPWTRVLGTKFDQAECTQFQSLPTGKLLKRIIGSEDCLYLNIWRPKSDQTNLPVYFWIHGGSNNIGSAKDYDGAALASQNNMIVVIIQYRLGPFGWFLHPSLKTGNPVEDSGNYGTLDQIKALQWVRNNIKAFGGNPKNVTIAGGGTGGYNVTNLLISPLAKGLFHKAISQSSGMLNAGRTFGIKYTDRTIKTLLETDGVDKNKLGWVQRGLLSESHMRKYLMNVDAEELLRARRGRKDWLTSHFVYIDGHVIPGKLKKVIESGNYNRVPIILGSNKYEMKPLIMNVPLGKTSSGRNYSDLYTALYSPGLSLDDVLPKQDDKDLFEAAGFYGSLGWRAEFVDSLARKLKTKQSAVYAYSFEWGGPGVGAKPADFILGAGHWMEMPFFFGREKSYFGLIFSKKNQVGRKKLQKAVMSYIGRFAHTGSPNKPGSGLPEWKPWTNSQKGPKVLTLDAGINKLKISMSYHEVIIEEIMMNVNGLPKGHQGLVRKYIWFK